MRLRLIFVLFYAALANLGGASSPTTVTAGKQLMNVTRWEQLWRFQVGQGNTLTLGDRYICLVTCTLRFAQTSKYGLQCGTCGMWHRFSVEFVEGNQVRLMVALNQFYLSCDESGSASLVYWKTPSTIFELSINEAEDQIVLYNPSVKKALSVDGDESVYCKGSGSELPSRFFGWKHGPEELWRASEEWQKIGYFDNRNSNTSKKFDYKTNVGVEDSWAGDALTTRGFQVEAGKDVFTLFSESIGESEIPWHSTPSSVWKASKRLSNSIVVAPRTAVNLYQAVGRYGMFTIRSLYFRAHDDKRNTVYVD